MSETTPFQEYLPYARQRWLAEQASWKRRRQAAWAAARRAAEVLRGQFAGERVLAFGSLVHSGPFDERSDIDLAVAGISPQRFFRAYAAAAAVIGPFEFDLVDLADCQPGLRAVILEEGVPL